MQVVNIIYTPPRTFLEVFKTESCGSSRGLSGYGGPNLIYGTHPTSGFLTAVAAICHPSSK